MHACPVQQSRGRGVAEAGLPKVRRALVRALAAGVAGALLRGPAQARAQAVRVDAARWPQRPIRLLVAYPPGGVSDQVARDLAERLARQLGVAVLTENRPGASGMLALEALQHGAADGQTLAFAAATAVALLAASRPASAAGGLPAAPGQPALPVVPVAGVMRTPVLVVGTPALKAGSFPDMLVLARASPGGLRWATTGEGTTGHAVLERVRRASGMAFVHIPYKGGGQQITDALGGHFELLSTNVAAQQLDAIRTGRLTALAVGATTRLPVLPDTPTLAELGFPAANLDSLFGLFAPVGTPAERVQRLNAEVAEALRHATLRDRLLASSNTPFEGSAAQFAEQVRREAVR